MSELKVDETFLEAVAYTTNAFMNELKEQIDKMLNKNEDIFVRYYAYSCLMSISESCIFINNLQKKAMIRGHNINHPFLQSDSAKQSEWDRCKLEEDYFFSSDEINIERDEIKSEMERFFRSLI